MAAGLALAAVLAVAQAWCVNAIHENLLWFSKLMVGSPAGPRVPVLLWL